MGLPAQCLYAGISNAVDEDSSSVKPGMSSLAVYRSGFSHAVPDWLAHGEAGPYQAANLMITVIV